MVSLISALLAWVTVGLGMYFISASHLNESGCIIDEQILGGAFLSALAGGLLSFIAAITGFAGMVGRGHAHGKYRALAIAGLVLGVIGLVACFGLLVVSTFPGRANPQYLHPC